MFDEILEKNMGLFGKTILMRFCFLAKKHKATVFG
jgi:hypothetical protein